MPAAIAAPDRAREELYQNLLLEHLAGRELKEILFFVNARRFELLERSIGELLRRPGTRVLNVAGGPFALEFYLAGRRAKVHSLDIDPALPRLHRAMVDAGLIEGSTHELTDVLGYETDEQYHLIIINDLLYSRHVDFHAVLAKYAPMLRPGGVLYFDILDTRAGGLWRAFNRDGRYRRYAMAEVRETLRRAGLAIEDEQPSQGIKGGLDRLARRALWRLFGTANNIIFRTRRMPPATTATMPTSAPAGIDCSPIEAA